MATSEFPYQCITAGNGVTRTFQTFLPGVGRQWVSRRRRYTRILNFKSKPRPPGPEFIARASTSLQLHGRTGTRNPHLNPLFISARLLPRPTDLLAEGTASMTVRGRIQATNPLLPSNTTRGHETSNDRRYENQVPRLGGRCILPFAREFIDRRGMVGTVRNFERRTIQFGIPSGTSVQVLLFNFDRLSFAYVWFHLD